MEIGADSTVNVNNAGTVSSVYIGDTGSWYYNTEEGAIDDFRKKYTSGSYAAHEYATHTYETNILGSGHHFYGYIAPVTVHRDNFVPPPAWNNLIAISYLHTHPGNPGNINHSGMDKIFSEVANRPFYVVTTDDYKPYTPQYNGDYKKIIENIGPQVKDDTLYRINHYLDKIWK